MLASTQQHEAPTCRLKAHEAVLRQKHEAALANLQQAAGHCDAAGGLSSPPMWAHCLNACLSNAAAVLLVLWLFHLSRWCACMTYDVLRAPLVPLQCPSGAFRLT